VSAWHPEGERRKEEREAASAFYRQSPRQPEEPRGKAKRGKREKTLSSRRKNDALSDLREGRMRVRASSIHKEKKREKGEGKKTKKKKKKNKTLAIPVPGEKGGKRTLVINTMSRRKGCLLRKERRDCQRAVKKNSHRGGKNQEPLFSKGGRYYIFRFPFPKREEGFTPSFVIATGNEHERPSVKS